MTENTLYAPKNWHTRRGILARFRSWLEWDPIDEGLRFFKGLVIGAALSCVVWGALLAGYFLSKVG